MQRSECTTCHETFLPRNFYGIQYGALGRVHVTDWYRARLWVTLGAHTTVRGEPQYAAKLPIAWTICDQHSSCDAVPGGKASHDRIPDPPDFF